MTTWGDYLAFGVIHVGNKARVWVSGQQTRLLQEKLPIFLSTTTVEAPVKAALPPFNLRVDVETHFDLVLSTP